MGRELGSSIGAFLPMTMLSTIRTQLEPWQLLEAALGGVAVAVLARLVSASAGGGEGVRAGPRGR
ncbi:hypothetical protein, partial [Rathayibacter tanaceti]|uniref:hypothetical protein n=1 Tax=Rathayibacter tanaceti TaxID=1671680 RepID=UPI001F3BA8C2